MTNRKRAQAFWSGLTPERRIMLATLLDAHAFQNTASPRNRTARAEGLVKVVDDGVDGQRVDSLRGMHIGTLGRYLERNPGATIEDVVHEFYPSGFLPLRPELDEPLERPAPPPVPHSEREVRGAKP